VEQYSVKVTLQPNEVIFDVNHVIKSNYDDLQALKRMECFQNAVTCVGLDIYDRNTASFSSDCRSATNEKLLPLARTQLIPRQPLA